MSSSANSESAVSHAYFPAFDVFRGIGIIGVILAHTPSENDLLSPIRPIGALGVHMFFALSGFLITFRLLEEHRQTGRINLAAFYRRRARRILPPAMLYLAVLAVLGPVLHLLPASASEIAASVFFYRNLIQPQMPEAWYTGHFWSLSLEEQFYLFWPVLLVGLGPRTGRAAWVALGIVAAVVLWRIRVFAIYPDANIYRSDLLADHLLWGCLVCLRWNWIVSVIERRGRLIVGVAAILAAAILIYRQPPYWQMFFAPCVAAGFIFAAEAIRSCTGVWKLFQTLGKASYDCYLWQSLFLALPFGGSPLPVLQRLPWSYLLVAVMTAVSFRLTFPRSRRSA